MTFALLVNVCAYGLALWLGLYLIARDPRQPVLLLAGLGLDAYALALALQTLTTLALPEPAPLLTAATKLALLLPAVCWSGALLHLLPPEHPRRGLLLGGWRYGITGLFLVLSLPLLLGTANEAGSAAGVANLRYAVLAVVVLVPLLAGTILVWRTARQTRPAGIFGLLLVALLFFALSTGLVFASALGPALNISTDVIALAIGLDLLLLGISITLLDAFDQGEAFLPDIARSFMTALLTGIIFGGQVMLVIALGTGPTPASIALLLGILGTAIAVQVFADTLQAGLDRLVFARFPRLRRSRAALRGAASAALRVKTDPALAALDDEEFARLTRRALSNLGNLPRLAASPLTQLPQIEERLAARGADDNTLDRANALKALLTENIQKLKPRGEGDFGTSDAWRYYNALYFPYVAGLKPYSRRHPGEANGDPQITEALDWFQQQVPERTLYNWQTAAARLIAQALREQSG